MPKYLHGLIVYRFAGLIRHFYYDVLNLLYYKSSTDGAVDIALSYDPEGRLYAYNSGGAVTYFLYDGTDLIGEYSTGGAVLRRYVHSSRDDDPQVWLEGAGNGNISYVYTNYQGSVIATTNAAGSNLQIYKYSPYGEPRDASNNAAWSGFRFRYTGQQILSEARLYHYKARAYDPVIGTFLQTDPIGSQDDLDLYAYVGDDPVNKTDPTGLGKEVDDICKNNPECVTVRGKKESSSSSLASSNIVTVDGNRNKGNGDGKRNKEDSKECSFSRGELSRAIHDAGGNPFSKDSWRWKNEEALNFDLSHYRLSNEQAVAIAYPSGALSGYTALRNGALTFGFSAVNLKPVPPQVGFASFIIATVAGKEIETTANKINILEARIDEFKNCGE